MENTSENLEHLDTDGCAPKFSVLIAVGESRNQKMKILTEFHEKMSEG